MTNSAKVNFVDMSNRIFNFTSESGWGESYLIVVLVFLSVATLWSIIALNIAGVLACIFLIGLLLLVIRKGVRKVNFYETHIELVSYLNKKTTISYQDIKEVYYQPMRHHEYVYVVKMRSNHSLKKFTFYCTKKKYDEVLIFLKGKGIKGYK